MSTQPDKMREAFEAWYFAGSAPKANEQKANGVYKHMPAYLAWTAWDAATEHAARICESMKVDADSYFEINERLDQCADAVRRGEV